MAEGTSLQGIWLDMSYITIRALFMHLAFGKWSKSKVYLIVYHFKALVLGNSEVDEIYWITRPNSPDVNN